MMFLFNQLIKIALLISLQYGTGLLVIKRGILVNYTRKINHFALFIIPMLLDDLLVYEGTITGAMINAVLSVCLMAFYTKPIRSRVPFIATMFASFDRPEDRPHTLSWLSTQVAVGWVVVLGMLSWMNHLGLDALIFIPILVNGIGDGLAEPIGVRFGKHKYKVYAMFSKRKYERSLEGSAAVFVTTVFVILFFQSSFTPLQFWVGLAVYPIIMTLTEAFSPHTWDTPFLLAVGYLSLIGLSLI